MPRSLTESQLLHEAQVRDIPISDAGLLRQALTHKSAVVGSPSESNERLEFLGDAILNMVVAEYLFNSYPDRTEGQLAKARSQVVCKSALAAAGVRMQITALIDLGATEEALGGRNRSSLVEDAYEALVAVIYIGHGGDVARQFILRTLAPELAAVSQSVDWRDPKTILQELNQGANRGLPDYQITGESGRPHDRTFTSEVRIDSETIGIGSGKSKKEAEQAAARAALDKLNALQHQAPGKQL